MWYKKHVVTTVLVSLLGLPLFSGCSFDADAGHRDHDYYERPAGYRYGDHDRDWDRDHVRHEWHDEHHDWDRD